MGMELNPAQQRAVHFPIDRPLLVKAGPGTGKTAVLVSRFVHLVTHHGLSPDRILFLTFTRAAAAEMKERVVQALESCSASELASKSFGMASPEGDRASSLWIHTFHAFALRVLQMFPNKLDFGPDFNEATDWDRQIVLDRAVSALYSLNGVPEDLKERIEKENPFKTRSDAYAFFSKAIADLKDRFIYPTDFDEKVFASLKEAYNFEPGRPLPDSDQLNALESESAWMELIRHVYSTCQTELESRNLLDYGDLLYWACKLFADTQLNLRSRFRYILVDELQDNNVGQYNLLSAVAAEGFANVTAVCDAKQTIYEWRQAHPDLLEGFPGETVHLDVNYRSSPEIVDAASKFILQFMEEEVPQKASGEVLPGEINCWTCQNRSEEASRIADELGGVRPLFHLGECAVLFRRFSDSAQLQMELRARRIPFVVSGGRLQQGSYWKTLLAVLDLAFNPHNDSALARIISSAGIELTSEILKESRNFINQLLNASSAQGVHLPSDSQIASLMSRLETLFDSEEAAEEEVWTEKVRRCIAAMEALFPRESMPEDELIDETSFDLSDMARRFHEFNPEASPEQFRASLSTFIEQGRSLPSEPLGIDNDGVKLFTIHQAKGLEFDVVFIASCKTPRIQVRETVAWVGDRVYLRKSFTGDTLARFKTEARPELHRIKEEEERRVFYVGVTRAKRKLYLSQVTESNKAFPALFADANKLPLKRRTGVCL